MISLPNIGDISEYVTSWQFSIEPSFDFIELYNGKIAKKHDLGFQADHFFTTLDISMPFSRTQNLISSYGLMKGLEVPCTTDRDLFFPGFTLSAFDAVVHELKFLGYEGDNFSKTAKFQLKMFLVDQLQYEHFFNVPNCLDRALWKNDHEYSDNFAIVENGQKYQFYQRFNDRSSWVVGLDYLTLDEAFQMLSWILTTRTDTVELTTNSINNYSTSSKTASYKIKSFDLRNNFQFYDCVLNLVEV